IQRLNQPSWSKAPRHKRVCESQTKQQESHVPLEGVEPSAIVGHALLKLQDAVAMGILRARQRLLQGFTVFSFMLLLLCVAAFLYGSFYYSYMPKAAFSTPVHYYYRTDCESPASFLCSYPVANISLLRNKKHVLTFGQVYRIYLQLEMPDSPTNHQVGMFMIKAAYFSQDGGQVAASTRSGMLRYRSDLLRTLGTLLFLPAFLSGAVEQKQVLEVELFSEYIDDPYSPSVTALIEIMSSKVQIYSSHLYVHAHFTGIRYLLFYFPVFSAFVGVFSNFIFLSFLFILSYIRQLFKVEQKPEQNHHLCSGRDSDMDTADDNKHMERMEMETEEAHKVPDETHGHLPASEEPIGSCRGDRGSFRPRLLATKSFPPYSQCIGGLGEDGDWDNEPSLEPNTTPCQSNEKEDTHEDIQDTERKADVTAKCSREVLRAKWRARRKEKLGSSFEVGTDGWERGRWSGKRRVEESGKETEHENEERAEGPNSEGKHWRGRSSGLEKEEEEEGRKVSASSAAQQENSISLETPKEHSEEMMEPSMHRHPILSKLLHSSSTSSSCSSINLSSGESEEVFSEGEDATLKRKTFKKVRTPDSGYTVARKNFFF
uniref:Seipin n=1 Tax=Kryptolebias marmoratus TaxID=37003 RepID=A0A3Q3A3N8_KRYMA